MESLEFGPVSFTIALQPVYSEPLQQMLLACTLGRPGLENNAEAVSHVPSCTDR